jgi:hypothetical protein
MMEDNQRTFLVRPSAKYGHAYLLSKQQYYFYRAFLIIFYGPMFLLLWVKTLAPAFCESSLALVCDLDPSIVLTAIIVGAFAQWKIASSGKLVSPEEAAKYSAMDDSPRLFSRNLYWLGASAASSAIAVVLLLSIHTRLLSERSIPVWAWVLLIICLFIPLHYFRKWRDSRKP